jgi:hypothetical protein
VNGADDREGPRQTAPRVTPRKVHSQAIEGPHHPMPSRSIIAAEARLRSSTSANISVKPSGPRVSFSDIGRHSLNWAVVLNAKRCAASGVRQINGAGR